MRVRGLVQKKRASVVSVQQTSSVSTALQTMLDRGVGGVVVIDSSGGLSGFISERDVIKALERHRSDIRQLPVSEVMHRAPTCDMEDPLRDVMTRLTTERLRHLVVLEEGRAVGVISVGDIVKHRLEELELETGVLRDYVAAQRAV